MLVVELMSPHSHSGNAASVFETELDELEREQGSGSLTSKLSNAEGKKALPLTLGLIMHGLADGLALGVSALDTDSHSDLSVIVFLALLIHKAPTTLAFTTSLLTTSLPRSDCKKHLAVFAASTPAGAILSYITLHFLQAGDGGWTGIALLVSGGTFLYVATVLQPVSTHDTHPSNVNSERMRVLLIVVGMFLPFVIGAMLGHGHEHAHASIPPARKDDV